MAQYTEKPTSLLSNLENTERSIAVQVVTQFPFLYIEDEARDVHGRIVTGCFALHTKKPHRDHGDVWRYYKSLAAGTATL